MDNCKICSGNFHLSPDQLVLCDHKGGMVHMGCCIHRCSQNGKVCKHGLSIYKKV